MTDPKQKSAEEMAEEYISSHPFTLAGFTRPEVELIQSAYSAAFLAGWHARDEEVEFLEEHFRGKAERNERDQLRAEVEKLRGLIEEAFESLCLIDMQKENFPEAAAENVQRFAHNAIERLSAAGIGEGASR